MSELGEDDVALKVLHTADWHLGKRFVSFDDADRTQLTRARLEVIDRILDVAEHNTVDAVLCAGDLFDEPVPEPMWWQGLAEKLTKRRWTNRPVILLPGNHDPLTETSVYHPNHRFRSLLPKWVHVVDRDDFEMSLAEHAVLVARPCRRQSGQDDNALLLPSRESGDERIRIGMVHGSTFDMPNYQANFPISKDAAVERGLDYLAIGDTHAFRVYPPEHAPTVYPSAPEPTTFGERDAGHVAVVFFPRSRRRPIVRKERVARYRWEERTVRDIAELRRLHDIEDLQRRVLRLVLEMRLPAAEYEEAQQLVARLQGTESTHGKVAVLQLDASALQLDTSTIEEELAGLPEILRKTAARLREREAAGDGEVARRALVHLYRLARAPASEGG